MADRFALSCAGQEDGSNGSGDPADATADEGEPTEAPAVEPDPLAVAIGERDRYREQMLRTAADFDNYRKRARKEIEDARHRGREDMLREVLPIFDNFERALAHAGTTDPAAVLDGLAMVARLLFDTLVKSGVTAIDEVGVPFDPTIHDALQQAPTDEVPPGTIVDVVQKGYRSGDRLVRPASVVVAVAAPTKKE